MLQIRNRLVHFHSLVFAHLVLIFGFSLGACALNSQTSAGPPPARLGVVVDSIAPGSEAESLDIKEGDVIFAWSGSGDRGEIHSPFELALLEITEKPRGPLTLEGLRGTEKKTWQFVIDSWGIKGRPVLPVGLAGRYEQGKFLAKGGKATEAAEAWRKVADELTADQPAWLGAWFLAHAAEVLAEAQHRSEADEYYQQALAKLPALPASLSVQLLRARAFSLIQEGEWKKAEVVLQEALRRSEALDPQGLLFATNSALMAVLMDVNDQPAEARPLFGRARSIQEQWAPDSAALAFTLLWLGALELDNANPVAADELLERAFDIESRKAPLSSDMAEICNQRGILARSRGDLATAEESFRRTLIIGERLSPNSFGSAAMLINLAGVERDRNNLIGAERMYQQALHILKSIGPQTSPAAAALQGLGETASDNGDYAAAREYFEKSLAIKRQRKNKTFMVSTLLGLGTLARRKGDLAEAKSWLEQALEIQQSSAPTSGVLANIYVSLAELALRGGDITSAEEGYRRALAVRERLMPDTTAHAEVLAALASIQMKEGKKSEASRLYERALNAFESQVAQLGGNSDLRADFRVQHANYYRDYVSFLMQQNETEHAFEVLERSRARSLLETLAAAQIRIRSGLDPALVHREELLRANISAKSELRIRKLTANQDDPEVRTLGLDISGLYSQMEEIQKKISVANPNYSALMQPEPLTLKQVQQQLLDQGTVLLEYSLGEDRSYVFVVSRHTLSAAELPGSAEISAAVRNVYRHAAEQNRVLQGASTTGGEQDFAAAALHLSKILLGPVAGQIGSRRLVIVADGPLQHLPFAMLPEPFQPGIASGRSEPLMVRHEVVALPSASVLAVLRQEKLGRTTPQRTVAVLADPVFDRNDPRVSGLASRPSDSMTRAATLPESDQYVDIADDLLTRSGIEIGFERNGKLNLPRLLQSRREAEAILAMSPRNQAMEAVDFDASRTTALSPELSKYRIIHFATHGLLNSQHPELSGLVFSLVDRNGNPQHGFLQLQDIYNMNLPADLVVLSACETGLGREISGEGLIGLTRGFMYAGASRVVASLWKVSDAATAELMQRFYRGMLQEHLTPAAALRQAQISMWKQKRWRSPYYWAAFQIQGDWN